MYSVRRGHIEEIEIEFIKLNSIDKSVKSEREVAYVWKVARSDEINSSYFKKYEAFHSDSQIWALGLAKRM